MVDRVKLLDDYVQMMTSLSVAKNNTFNSAFDLSEYNLSEKSDSGLSYLGLNMRIEKMIHSLKFLGHSTFGYEHNDESAAIALKNLMEDKFADMISLTYEANSFVYNANVAIKKEKKRRKKAKKNEKRRIN